MRQALCGAVVAQPALGKHMICSMGRTEIRPSVADQQHSICYGGPRLGDARTLAGATGTANGFVRRAELPAIRVMRGFELVGCNRQTRNLIATQNVVDGVINSVADHPDWVTELRCLSKKAAKVRIDCDVVQVLMQSLKVQIEQSDLLLHALS